jgi:hypothetical protein
MIRTVRTILTRNYQNGKNDASKKLSVGMMPVKNYQNSKTDFSQKLPEQ